MKRKVFFYSLIFAAMTNLNAQDLQKQIAGLVTECINALGKPVPDGYTRIDRRMYKKDIEYTTIVLIVENGKVHISSLGCYFSTTNTAAERTAIYYSTIENIGVFHDSSYDGDIYKINNTYALIVKPTKREDGFIATAAFFSQDISNLY